MNRQTALAAGLTFYETGKICRNGHVGPRYSKTGHCVACLKDARTTAHRLQNTGMAARSEGLTLFTYKLHPEDCAAALAFCQALDLQRGRMPQAAQAVAAPSPAPFTLPPALAAAQAVLAQYPELDENHNRHRK